MLRQKARPLSSPPFSTIQALAPLPLCAPKGHGQCARCPLFCMPWGQVGGAPPSRALRITDVGVSDRDVAILVRLSPLLGIGTAKGCTTHAPSRRTLWRCPSPLRSPCSIRSAAIAGADYKPSAYSLHLCSCGQSCLQQPPPALPLFPASFDAAIIRRGESYTGITRTYSC